MTTASLPDTTINRGTLWLLFRAGLLTALSDGLFASLVNRFVFHSTITRVWQGVAGTLLGRSAFEGGLATVLVGLVMHVGVALGWSLVLLTSITRWPRIRGVLVCCSARRPLTARWWVQLLGHFPFVGLPMAAALASGMRRPS